MSNILNIKGKIVGEGAPLVCVPVMAKDKAGIVEAVKKLAEKKVDMIEWRVDAFENADSMNSIREVLDEIAPYLEETILVYTYRSSAQGGLGTFDTSLINEIHLAGAETKIPDFIDMEYFVSEHPKRKIKEIQEYGVYVISSHHDFEETPDAQIINMLLRKMNESGTDVVKLAVMPKDIRDVLVLLNETVDFHTEYPDKPLITMSMGAVGSVSRVTGEYFGSCVTFGADEEASAPGQLPFNELGDILDNLHKSIERG